MLQQFLYYTPKVNAALAARRASERMSITEHSQRTSKGVKSPRSPRSLRPPRSPSKEVGRAPSFSAQSPLPGGGEGGEGGEGGDLPSQHYVEGRRRGGKGEVVPPTQQQPTILHLAPVSREFEQAVLSSRDARRYINFASQAPVERRGDLTGRPALVAAHQNTAEDADKVEWTYLQTMFKEAVGAGQAGTGKEVLAGDSGEKYRLLRKFVKSLGKKGGRVNFVLSGLRRIFAKMDGDGSGIVVGVLLFSFGCLRQAHSPVRPTQPHTTHPMVVATLACTHTPNISSAANSGVWLIPLLSVGSHGVGIERAQENAAGDGTRF